MRYQARILTATAALAIAIVAATISTADAQQKFKSPDEAVTALVAAIRADSVLATRK